MNCRTLACAIVLWCALPVLGGELEPAPEGMSGSEIAKRAEDTLYSATTYLAAEMTIVSPRLSSDRVVAFENWDDRVGNRSFIRITKPIKDADTTFLKLHPNLWMHIPRVERTMRIPPSMMLQSWMGSDLTNDDLVRESSALKDYDHVLLGVDPSPLGHPEHPAFVVEYQPHEDAPVVWGKIVTWIDVERGAPLRQEYFDEDGEKLRLMEFSDITLIDGRHYPRSWRMRPLDKEGHETRIEVSEVRFDIELDEQRFTKRALTRDR